MNVLMSKLFCKPLFKPSKPPAVCSDQLMYLCYGLGNSYSFVEFITYYHNCYDPRSIQSQSTHDTDDGRKDFSADFNYLFCFRLLSDNILNKQDLSIRFKVRGPPEAFLTL